MRRSLSLSSSNALTCFDAIEHELRDKTLIILLDYDGTLSPIVSDPSQAFISDATRELLRELSHYHYCGIVTGRSIEKILGFVNVDTLFYAGSHGFDIRGPNHTDVNHQVAVEHLPWLHALRDELSEELRTISGAQVEDNAFSVSVHYRNVCETNVPDVIRIVEAMVSKYEVTLNHHIKKGNGKKVLELKPDIEWDKGRAVLWLLEKLQLDRRDDVYTIYVGDDVTDEDAFKVFRLEMPLPDHVKGCGILVTEEERITNATYTLRDPSQVCDLLKRLLELAISHNGHSDLEDGLTETDEGGCVAVDVSAHHENMLEVEIYDTQSQNHANMLANGDVTNNSATKMS